MELAPDPGIKPLRTTPGISLLAMVKESTTPASVSLSLRIFIQRSDTITLESKATKANEPMTPAKTTEPTQMESTSSNRGSGKKEKNAWKSMCDYWSRLQRDTNCVTVHTRLVPAFVSFRKAASSSLVWRTWMAWNKLTDSDSVSLNVLDSSSDSRASLFTRLLPMDLEPRQ